MEKYRSVFARADVDGDGFVEPTEARAVLDELAQIYTLADVDKDGRLNEGEFLCALHLAPMASKGFLACNPFREVCCSNSAAEHSDVYDGAQNQTLIYGEEDGGARYKGQWRGNMRHGHGVLTRADGHRYEGAWLDNRAHGHGTFTESSGTSYEGPDGQWHQDQKHGYGKYVHIDGTTYEGEWHSDEKSGRGIETWSDGARYEGEFLHGSKHGVGVYKSGTGVQYEGQMDGEGTYRFANGRVYVGQWAMGHMSGYGKMEMPDGSRYEGGYEPQPHWILLRSRCTFRFTLGDLQGPLPERFYTSYHERDQPFSLPQGLLPTELPGPLLALAQRSDENWSVKAEELGHYLQTFQRLDAQSKGIVGQEEGREIFERSGLPVQELSFIWQLSDRDADGSLVFQEFAMAMAIVARRRRGWSLPTALPAALVRSVEAFSPSWSISSGELESYRTIFQRVDRNGVADLAATKDLLEQSQLPVSELSAIYAMSDLDHDGRLSEPEFLCTMALAARRRKGAPLPEQLPLELREACWSMPSTPAEAAMNQPNESLSLWQPNQEELSRFQQLFDQLQDHGFVSADMAREAGLALLPKQDQSLPGSDSSRRLIQAARDVPMAGRTLQFIGGVFVQTTRMYLKQAMERFGEVEVCHMGNRNNPEEEPPWVRFMTEKAAQDALDALNKGEVYVDGNQLKAQWRPARGGKGESRRPPPEKDQMNSRKESRGRSGSRDRRRRRSRSRSRSESLVAGVVLESSGLPLNDLAKIWDLADVGDDGKLSLGEFLCAMSLSARRREGRELPQSLPDELLPCARLRVQDKVEMQRYLAMFQEQVPRGGAMPAAKAAEILQMSELPPSDLAQIWNLSGGTDSLDSLQFLHAMALTARRREGQALPAALPPDLLLAAQLVELG
eukprot:s615_g18.t1